MVNLNNNSNRYTNNVWVEGGGWRVDFTTKEKKLYKISRNNVSANFILTNFAMIY